MSGHPRLQYTVPDWGGHSNKIQHIEVIKDGVVVDRIEIGVHLEFVSIGRAPDCDIILDNPTVSRFHCVLQFDKTGKLWLVDLKSSHGTRINRVQCQPDQPYLLNYGSMAEFGLSTRKYVFLDGNPDPNRVSGISWGLDFQPPNLPHQDLDPEHFCFQPDQDEDSGDEFYDRTRMFNNQ